MGSVKDLIVVEKPKESKRGIGRFVYSDRYSVFDWGEMPDLIPQKGKALCIMTSYFFKELEKKGIKTHYRGLVENNEVKDYYEIDESVNEMEVWLYQVIRPKLCRGQYDYSVYKNRLNNCLIPLEVIYRNTLPEHSNFRKRVLSGELDVKDYGLDSLPSPDEFLETPILDVSTKLEASDRYISWKEAQEISGLSNKEISQMKSVLSEVNNLITEKARLASIENLDGKIELAFDENREMVVVDAIGTPDECRFSFNGFSISKEAARKYYRKTQWHAEVQEVKKDGGEDWKEKVGTNPPKLPGELVQAISNMYMACANEITGKEWFKEVPSLTQIINVLEKYL